MQKTDFRLLALAFFFLFFFLLLIGYAPERDEEKAGECDENATRNCYVGGCPGEQRCVNGRWSGCYLNIVCIPGAVAPCVVDYCARTYKICNECGSGYSDCMPRDLLFPPNKSEPP